MYMTPPPIPKRPSSKRKARPASRGLGYLGETSTYTPEFIAKWRSSFGVLANASDQEVIAHYEKIKGIQPVVVDVYGDTDPYADVSHAVGLPKPGSEEATIFADSVATWSKHPYYPDPMILTEGEREGVAKMDGLRVARFLESAISYIEHYNRDGWGKKQYRENVTGTNELHKDFIGLKDSAHFFTFTGLEFGIPIIDTSAGWELYNATVKNLQPVTSTISNSKEYRQWQVWQFFKNAALPVTRAEISKEAQFWQSLASTREDFSGIYGDYELAIRYAQFSDPDKPYMEWILKNAPVRVWNAPNRMMADPVASQTFLWDAPGMFYKFDYRYEMLVSVFKSTMAQFYGTMPTPDKRQPDYHTYADYHWRVIQGETPAPGLGRYGEAINELFSKLPVEVVTRLASKKPPYITANEYKERWQTRTGTNLGNMESWCAWVMAGGAGAPKYKKAIPMPSRSDEIKSVALSVLGFALAFVGVPAAIGALNVTLSKVLENYQIEKMQETTAEQQKADAVILEAQKEQEKAAEQIAAINAEIEAIRNNKTIPTPIATKKNLLSLTVLTLLASMVM